MRSFYSRNLLDTKAKKLNSWVQVPTVDQWQKTARWTDSQSESQFISWEATEFQRCLGTRCGPAF